MISKEFALIITVLTLGVGGTIALANSPQEPPSSLLVSETTIFTKEEENRLTRKDRTEQFQQVLNLTDEQMQQLSTIRQKISSADAAITGTNENQRGRTQSNDARKRIRKRLKK